MHVIADAAGFILDDLLLYPARIHPVAVKQSIKALRLFLAASANSAQGTPAFLWRYRIDLVEGGQGQFRLRHTKTQAIRP